MKKYKLLMLHHSHTDIGYTNTQQRIILDQTNYLRKLVKDYKNDSKQFKGFVWVAEALYIVKEFLATATTEQKNVFKEMISKGIVSISASHLHFQEIASDELFGKTLEKDINLSKKELGIKLEHVMSNDITGFSYGYGQQYADQGIKYLFSGLHTHHSFFPAFKKQHPFYWKMKDGKKILVWIGEQYMIGSEFGFLDLPTGDYVLQDGRSGSADREELNKLSKIRLADYIKKLEDAGYPFDFIPVSQPGAGIDNAPPNYDLANKCKYMEEVFKDVGVESIEMSTLENFFDHVEKASADIPTYTGDWPDWWTDGSASFPELMRIGREAQRRYEAILRLNTKNEYAEDIDYIEQNLIMFSEHTFTGFDNTERPFKFKNLEQKFSKYAYATKALERASYVLDKLTNYSQFKLMDEKNNIKIQITNPFDSHLDEVILLNEHTNVKEKAWMENGFSVTMEGKEQKVYKALVDGIQHMWVQIKVKPKQKTIITINPKKGVFDSTMTSPITTFSSDKVSDVHSPHWERKGLIVENGYIETKFFKVLWNDYGFTSVVDKRTGEELIDSTKEPLMQPLYEVNKLATYEPLDMFAVRQRVGRNRKHINSRIHKGTIIDTKIKKGPESLKLEFKYDVQGSKYYMVSTEMFYDSPVIDFEVHQMKDTEWNMESCYISLPFTNAKIELDKGQMFEPRKEQIPGTLIDYYSVQSGASIQKGKTKALLVTMDQSLLWMGPMKYQDRYLAGSPGVDKVPFNLYAWTMNNAWETNFGTDLGGFHQLRYRLVLTDYSDKTTEQLKANSTRTIKQRVLK